MLTRCNQVRKAKSKNKVASIIHNAEQLCNNRLQPNKSAKIGVLRLELKRTTSLKLAKKVTIHPPNVAINPINHNLLLIHLPHLPLTGPPLRPPNRALQMHRLHPLHPPKMPPHLAGQTPQRLQIQTLHNPQLDETNLLNVPISL